MTEFSAHDIANFISWATDFWISIQEYDEVPEHWAPRYTTVEIRKKTDKIWYPGCWKATGVSPDLVLHCEKLGLLKRTKRFGVRDFLSTGTQEAKGDGLQNR